MKQKFKIYAMLLVCSLVAACASNTELKAVSYTIGLQDGHSGEVAVKRIISDEERSRIEAAGYNLNRTFNPVFPFYFLDSEDLINGESDSGKKAIVLDNSDPWELYRPYWFWGKKTWSGKGWKARGLASENTWEWGKLYEYRVPEGPDKITYRDLFYMEGYNDCTTHLVLPESLRVIPDRAFQLWPYLREVTIPSGVTEIGKDPFDGCVNLRTVRNLSNQTVSLPASSEYSGFHEGNEEFGYDYYVDGEKVTEVPAGKTAEAKGRVFSLRYDLNGGSLVGTMTDRYRVGEETSLPSAERKGYTFLGWSIFSDSKTWFSFLYDEDSSITGDKTLVARWKKINAKKTGKKKIQIKVSNRNFDDKWPIACLYSTEKSMVDAKLVHLGVSYAGIKKKTVSEKKKNYTIKINRKKELLTCNLKNLKKKKTYYLEFKRIGSVKNKNTKYLYVGAKILKRIKIKL